MFPFFYVLIHSLFRLVHRRGRRLAAILWNWTRRQIQQHRDGNRENHPQSDQ